MHKTTKLGPQLTHVRVKLKKYEAPKTPYAPAVSSRIVPEYHLPSGGNKHNILRCAADSSTKQNFFVYIVVTNKHR